MVAKVIGAVFGVLLLMYVIAFVASGGDYAIYRFWAPKMENAHREVFENTQSYVEGKTEYLGRLRLQYQQASGQQKEALRSLILSEASTVDQSKLPPDLQAFLRSIGDTP